MHDLVVRVLQHVCPLHPNEILVHAAELTALGRWRWQQLAERVELVLVVSRVGHGWTGEFLEARVLPLRVLAVVIDVEDATVVVSPLLPAGGQRPNAALEVEAGLG